MRGTRVVSVLGRGAVGEPGGSELAQDPISSHRVGLQAGMAVERARPQRPAVRLVRERGPEIDAGDVFRVAGRQHLTVEEGEGVLWSQIQPEMRPQDDADRYLMATADGDEPAELGVGVARILAVDVLEAPAHV